MTSSSLAPTTARLLPTPRGKLVVSEDSPDPTAGIRLSLVIPTYDESTNLPLLVEQLDALLTPVLGSGFELIVVDDDSPDRTWAVALELAERVACVRVVRREGERGLGTAVIRGWQVARGSVLGVMDADLQHPAEVNLALLKEIERGAELAVASRHVTGGGVSDWSVSRRALSRGAQLIGLLLLPSVLGRVSDPMSGYFMLRRSALAGVVLEPRGYKILIEVMARTDIRWIGEVGYVFRERTGGESKVTWRLYLEYLEQLLKLRWATLPRSIFLKFCIVGASGVLVDMSLLYVLSDPGMLGLGLTRSKIVAAEVALVSNFLFNDFWTFRELSQAEPGGWQRARRFLGFNAICSAGLFLNVVVLNVLFNLAHQNRYLANAIAILVVTGWNYWLNRKLNWAARPTGREWAPISWGRPRTRAISERPDE